MKRGSSISMLASLLVVAGCAELKPMTSDTRASMRDASITGDFYKNAPAVWFSGTAAGVEAMLADWCGSPRKLQGPWSKANVDMKLTGREPGSLMCEPERDFSDDGRVADTVPSGVLDNVTAIEGRFRIDPDSTRDTAADAEDDGKDMIREWFVFRLKPADGGTCVRTEVQVQRNELFEPRAGSYTNVPATLAELGGVVSPESCD